MNPFRVKLSVSSAKGVIEDQPESSEASVKRPKAGPSKATPIEAFRKQPLERISRWSKRSQIQAEICAIVKRPA